MMRERVMLGGSLFTAITASLCCIGPLAAILLGLGSFGAAAVFESWRPYLLGATFALLAAAFYFTYRQRKAACADGSVCVTRPAAARWDKIMLWLTTGLVVAFAAFPYYSALVWAFLLPQQEPGASVVSVARGDSQSKTSAVTTRSAVESTPDKSDRAVGTVQEAWPKVNRVDRRRVRPVSAAAPPSLTQASIQIRGMTCTACAINVEQALGTLPGVHLVKASFEKSEARVEYDPTKVGSERLKAAINGIGYKAGAARTYSLGQRDSPSAASQKVEE